MFIAKVDFIFIFYGFDDACDVLHRDVFWILAAQTQHHGQIGGVAFSRQRKRAVQIDFDTDGLLELVLVAQFNEETFGSAPRAKRVRA